MPAAFWRIFDRLANHFPAPTQARSNGEAIVYLLRRDQQDARWLDWDQQKQVRLLSRTLSSNA
jgi:hypothetical protein